MITVSLFGVNDKAVSNDLGITNNLSCEESVLYKVQAGDNLYNIAQSFGHHSFWEYIYVANSSSVENPHRIFPGQHIEIPSRIASYKDSDLDLDEVLDNPYCSAEEILVTEVKEEFLISFKMEKLLTLDSLLNVSSRNIRTNLASSDSSITNKKDSAQSSEKEALDRFREAFNDIVSKESKEEKTSDINRSDLIRYEIDGIVLDETISKVGRDFYQSFYQNWSPPEDAYNFTITISEKPSPSLGTIVMVKVNETYTFQSRLQPRYELLVEAGEQAVRNTRRFLTNNDNRLKIY
ncbi:MAG: CsgE family curli-type amyloid fiber assembly protein [Gracilimonas sp.]